MKEGIKMDIIKFIPQQLLILVASVYVLGIFLKQTESIKDKYITIILMAFSIALSLILQGLNATAFLQGILCWGVSVGIHQTAKQLAKEEQRTIRKKQVFALVDKDEFYVNVIKQQQDEFLKRLDEINKRNNITNRIRTICITILVCIWIVGFIITHYILQKGSANYVGMVKRPYMG